MAGFQETLLRISHGTWIAICVTEGSRMEGFWQDFRFGMRSLMRNRRFALLAVLGLALGIGAKTAIFTVGQPVLLRPLPYRDSGKLLLIQESAPQQDLSVAYL